MPVTGSFYAGHRPRPVSNSIEPGQPQSTPSRSTLHQPASTRATPSAPRVTLQPPAHFSMISTISPGSLASAYQALRAAPAARTQGEPVILSALGVPAALAAYDEVREAD